MSRLPIPEHIQRAKGFRPTQAKEHVSIATEGRPTCPKFLTPAERQRFRIMSRQLEARRMLTTADGELLSLYATTFTRWRKAMADVVARGEVIITMARGKNDELLERERKNPWLVVAQESEKTMLACLDRLGFTPLNREKTKPVKADEEKQPTVPGTAAWLLEQAELEDAANAN
jgi:P27 family predicted phage terminase small subunit